MPDTLRDLVADLRSSLQATEPVVVAETPARYELFYHPNSICSQKVRAVLAHHQIAYTGRFVDIAAGETYLPAYVRIRLIGCRNIPGPLARRHTGSTSVRSGGCDAAVVPTLLDWDTDDVIVDSRRIGDHIDSFCDRSSSLKPAELVARIDERLEIIDDFPNYQLRLGSPPGGGVTPVMQKGAGGRVFGLSKVDRCRRYVELHPDDPHLIAAYQAKLEKELQATDELLTETAMERVYEAVAQTLRRLDRVLADSDTEWLFGTKVTMADLYWAIQLLRIENMCGDSFWKGSELSFVRRYLTAVRGLAAIQAVVTVGPSGVT